jgi:carbon-monoxide dehydrogenase large subunit
MSTAASLLPYGCHVAEVEIDIDTGLVTLARYTAIDDVGRAVNPMIVKVRLTGELPKVWVKH